MRILVVSRSEWDTSNSTGNTLSNLFAGVGSDSISNISFRGGVPNNSVCTKYFILSEARFLQPIFRIFSKFFLKHNSLKAALPQSLEKNRQGSVESWLTRKYRGTQHFGVYLLQDLFWRLPWWKNAALKKFLLDFSPDVIFFPSFGMPYTHRAVRYFAKLTHAPLVSFHADDYYFQSLEECSFLKKIFFKLRSSEVARTIKFSDLNYVITEKQQRVYSDFFNAYFGVLKKGIDLAGYPRSSSSGSKYAIDRSGSAIRFVYAGSLEYGRWRTMLLLVKSMERLRLSGLQFFIDIYSQYEIPAYICDQIIVPGISRFLGSVSADDVAAKIEDSDFALHLESFSDCDIELTRFSFSTKLLDCLGSSTCVFAFGPPNIASMEYMVDNRLGVTCTEPNDIDSVLTSISDDFSSIALVSENSRSFVAKYHHQDAVRERLMSDMLRVSNSRLANEY